MREIEGITDLGKLAAVKWRMTYACNYDCSYCIQRNARKKESRTGGVSADTEKCAAAAGEVSRIIDELGEKAESGVLLEMIGGEVTLLDLDRILGLITSPHLKRVNITTNFSKGADYFISLYRKLKERGVELVLTMSLHTPQTSLEKFESEILKFKAGADGATFKCETVTYDDTPDDPEMLPDGRIIEPEHKDKDYSGELWDFCEENGIDCMVDRDLTAPVDKPARGMKKRPRYRISFSDGTCKELLGRSALITGQDSDTSCFASGGAVASLGYYCTRDYDYVYIKQDRHVGFCKGGADSCKGIEPLEDFHVLDCPALCTVPRCSLCGRMSLSKNPDGISVKRKQDFFVF